MQMAIRTNPLTPEEVKVLEEIIKDAALPAPLTAAERARQKMQRHAAMYGSGTMQQAVNPQLTALQAQQAQYASNAQAQSLYESYRRQYVDNSRLLISDEDLMNAPATSLAAVHEIARLRRELHELQYKHDDMKRRFSTLFRVPLENVNASLENLPAPNLEAYQIRVHVEAFDITCTMGELAAARVAPGAARTWGNREWDNYSDGANLRTDHMQHVINHVSHQAVQIITQRMLKEDNKITAAEQNYTVTGYIEDDEADNEFPNKGKE